MVKHKIKEISPLYEFWKSDQDEINDKQRRLKANKDQIKSILFLDEPYKWEQLFQSIVREIINGDKSCIKALFVLLETLDTDVQNQLIRDLEGCDVLDDSTMEIIKKGTVIDTKKSRNYYRLIKILFAIFINPYGINNKRPKNHLYERTGQFFYRLRSFNQ